MIKNVFFDLDGTVINSERSVLNGLRMCMTKYGYDIPEYAVLRTCIGPPFSYSFREIFHVTEEDYPKVLAEYRNYYDNGGMYDCDVYEGVEGLLHALVERGYSLNICSSKPESACKKLLEKLGIDKYFSDIVGSSGDGRIDSKLDVIEECFRRAPWKKKDETVLIGDTKYDVEGAVAGDIDCICVSWGFGERQEMLDFGALEVFDTCDEVLDYIETN